MLQWALQVGIVPLVGPSLRAHMQEDLWLADNALAGKATSCSHSNNGGAQSSRGEGTCAVPGMFDERQLRDIESIGGSLPKRRRRNTKTGRDPRGDTDPEAPTHNRRHRVLAVLGDDEQSTTNDAVPKPRLKLLSDDHEA